MPIYGCAGIYCHARKGSDGILRSLNRPAGAKDSYGGSTTGFGWYKEADGPLLQRIQRLCLAHHIGDM